MPGKAVEGEGVFLWTFDLDAPGRDLARLEAMLSEEERTHLERFGSARARARNVIVRAAVRAILGGRMGRDPHDVALGRRDGGKPELVDGGALDFSLSHSGRLALLAVSTGMVGADLEEVRPRAGLDRVAEGLFSDAERADLAALEGARRLARFYATWTAREAYVKAIGRGLGAPRDSFELPPEGPGGPVPIREPGRPEPRLWLMRLEPAPGFVGAVVAEDLAGGLHEESLPEVLRADS